MIKLEGTYKVHISANGIFIGSRYTVQCPHPVQENFMGLCRDHPDNDNE